MDWLHMSIQLKSLILLKELHKSLKVVFISFHLEGGDFKVRFQPNNKGGHI